MRYVGHAVAAVLMAASVLSLGVSGAAALGAHVPAPDAGTQWLAVGVAFYVIAREVLELFR